jgi:hypothetical protein
LRQDLVGHNFARLPVQAVFERPSPHNPEFGIDVNDVDPSNDGVAEVVIIGSRPAVQCEKYPAAFLIASILSIQPLSLLPLHHTPQHAVHIADGRSEDVDAGSGNELPIGIASVIVRSASSR